MGKVLSMTFSSSLANLCEVNSSFDSGVLRICYTGENRNGSSISREAIEQSIPTLYNCPIVCNYDRESDTIGGHDMSLIRDDDGNIKVVNETQPIGVIPESANVWFENGEDENGVEHEYLYADVLLWKRQEAYSKVKRDGATAHSMEINVDDGETVNGVYQINKFEFTAFCLLGDAEPCFENSALEMFSMNDVKQQITEMMNEVKETFAIANDNHKQSTEGGDKELDEKEKLISEYGINVDTLDFSIEDLTVEELKEKFESMKATETEEKRDEQYNLAGNIGDELSRVLGTETVQNEHGQFQRYCIADYDTDKQEVYAWDFTDWLLYGFTFQVNGDAIEVDFDSKKRMKYEISEFDGEEQPSPFFNTFESLNQVIDKNAEYRTMYDNASNRITSMESELNDLRQFKLNVETKEIQSKREEIFSRFTDLVGVESFENLRENCEDISLEDLEEKCFAIRGRNSSTMKFNLNEEKSPKLKVEKPTKAEEPYGGIFTEYGYDSLD